MDWFNLVDNRLSGHIIAYIQNLILSYDLDGNNRSNEIAAEASIEWQKKTKNWGQSSSAVWCPLIWKALRLSGKSVPTNWTLIRSFDKVSNFDSLAKELAEIPGWSEYAEHILKKELREPAFANKFHNPEIGDPNNMLVERYNFIKVNNPTLF
tara:strand:+ start:188 stop:646 length:459 start_codon:yes stop_codon:yes gene_type:complete